VDAGIFQLESPEDDVVGIHHNIVVGAVENIVHILCPRRGDEKVPRFVCAALANGECLIRGASRQKNGLANGKLFASSPCLRLGWSAVGFQAYIVERVGL